MTKEEILNELSVAVQECKPERSKAAAQRALKEGIDPVYAINHGLVVGMTKIGDDYAAKKIYLPQVLVAAHAMYEGLDVLLPAIPKGDLADSKTCVTAVVQGDVHDIGKNIVKTMLTAGGFIVTDLGKDVPPGVIADISKEKGVDVVAISTLMTPTMDSMAMAIKEIEKKNYRKNCIVTIGGPPTSESFAKEIGADHRDDSAQDCVAWLKKNM